MIKVVPEIRKSDEMTLAGLRMTMSFANNTTFQLWNTFMSRKKEIANSIGSEMYSVQLYPGNFFANFNPAAEFEKWAAIQVPQDSEIPEGLEKIVIPAGLYAVFHYNGSNLDAAPFFSYIFREWLPASGYALDSRPHFELLGEKYRNGSPDSEEDIWIPIR